MHVNSKHPPNNGSQATENEAFGASLNADGLYNTFQFVLRLSPSVHEKLASGFDGVAAGKNVDADTLQAFATYLHETVHWWQHVGSTYGLVMSLTYPAQAQANYHYLKRFLAEFDFKKSVLNVARSLTAESDAKKSDIVNRIINNHFDLGAFRSLTISPKTGATVVESPMFECIGHAFQITYRNVIELIAAVSDREFKVIPNHLKWEEVFGILRDENILGYFLGSTTELYPIGAAEIFEGQARLVQLQYLHFATKGRFNMQAALDAKMFNGVYGQALEVFCEIVQIDFPTSIDHPTVALFLLICDLALNSGSGFPFPLNDKAMFVEEIDPGTRFVNFCETVRDRHPDLTVFVRDYSREEYVAVCEKLCTTMATASPIEIAKEFVRWSDLPEFVELIAQYNSFKFKNTDIVVRVLFSHFLAFMRDKSVQPEFFCWPGVWMGGVCAKENAFELFDTHSALFIDIATDESIYPRIIKGRNESDVIETFNRFYSNSILFDLTRQWILEDGPFRYDFKWLSTKPDAADFQMFAEQVFGTLYGCDMTSVQIFAPQP